MAGESRPSEWRAGRPHPPKECITGFAEDFIFKSACTPCKDNQFASTILKTSPMIEKARRAEFPYPRPQAWAKAFAANAACKAAIALHYRKPFLWPFGDFTALRLSKIPGPPA
jgi:hypothetical protein